MLVLTRKKGQKLIIGDNIEITILESRGDSVKIGINAPREVSIFREEIYEEIKKANVQAQKEMTVEDLNAVIGLGVVKKDMSDDYKKKIQSLSNKLRTNEKK